MEDAFGVRRVERVGHLHGNLDQRPEFEGPAVEPLVERFALEQLHRQVALAAFLIEAVDGADVGMVERGRGAGFAPEPFERLGRRRVAGRQHLDGHLPAELGVLRPVDDAHAACTELVSDAIVPEGLANQGVRHDPGWTILSPVSLDRKEG